MGNQISALSKKGDKSNLLQTYRNQISQLSKMVSPMIKVKA